MLAELTLAGKHAPRRRALLRGSVEASSSTRQACANAEDTIGLSGMKFVADVLIVVGTDVGGEHLADHGYEVGQGSNPRQRRIPVRPSRPANSRQSKRVPDSTQRHGAFI